MSHVTLEEVQAKQIELAALIAELQLRPAREARPVVLTIPSFDIELRAGEIFGGTVLKKNGEVDHHTIYMPTDGQERDFDEAQTYAAEIGGDAPSSEESWLLLANPATRAKLPNWWWLNKAQGAVSAWGCYSNGNQFYDDRSSSGGAVVVRRLFPSIL